MDASFVPKRAKYNANGRRVGSVWCASDAEATRYEQLLDMEARGIIERLETQPNYPLVVNGRKIGAYRADFRFTYLDPEHPDPRGYQVVEEVKGLETPEWKLKQKLVEALYGLKIRVIRKPPNKLYIAENHPELVEAMHGKTSDFSHWIRVRFKDRIAD